MKHLSKFESFFQTKLLPSGVDADDLRDICLDITDYGRFEASVNSIYTNGAHKNYVFIHLSDPRDYDGFTISEVKDVVIRLKEFLGSHYGGCSLQMVGFIGRVDIEIDNNDSIINKYHDDTDRISNLVVWIV